MDTMRLDSILRRIRARRFYQHEKFGQQAHGLTVWLTVMAEEVGEVSRGILTLRSIPAENAPVRQASLEHIRSEFVDVAAVAVAAIERIDAELSRGGTMPQELWE